MSTQHPEEMDSGSEDDIEMANLDEVLERSGSPHQNGIKLTPYDPDQEDLEDEDAGLNEEGSRALLGPQGRTRGRERNSGYLGKLWPQVKNIVIESAPTLLLTTLGLLFTGELLEKVSRWRAMKEVDQLIMIIPVLLNLKGNLEMNLSARLGTAANIGELDDPKVRLSMIIGNLSLLQVQATVVSFVAAGVSLILGLIVPRTVSPVQSPPSPSNTTTLASLASSTNYGARGLITGLTLHSRRPSRPLPINEGVRKSGFAEFIMVASTSMSAACLSSLILGSFMCFLIVLCRRFGRDPDNIAPPVASCLGDLVTLILIGMTSTGLIRFIHTPFPFIVGMLVILSTVSCLIFTRRNHHVKDLLTQGWSPLFGAMVISSGTGIVLDMFVSRYQGFALLSIVISGLPGSVGSIFVSRLSTALHAAAHSLSSFNPSLASSRDTPEPSPRVVMITLLVVTLPVELLFLAALRVFGWVHLPFVFAAFSVVFFCCAVLISLIIAQLLTNYLWSRKLDPDMYALPIHSALMDLIGQLLLVLCFEIASLLGAQVRMKIPS